MIHSVAFPGNPAAHRYRRVMPRVVIDPGHWQPPSSPGLFGPYAENSDLRLTDRWPTPGAGPEDVVVAADGAVYAGLEDGRILRFPPGGGTPATVAATGGRPLGLELDAGGRLVVCDANRGLLRIDDDGAVTTLVDSYEGRPLRFTNNADIAADGTIYFTDTSVRFGIAEYRSDLLEHRPNGRLFSHRPDTGETRLLADGLFFANGVALAADGSFVLVAETGRYRITRLWLGGTRAGESDTFVENLPGFPDNMSRSERGVFWVALPNRRDRKVDFLLPRPRLRKLVARLPQRLQPRPRRFGFVLGFDATGRVVHNLQDPTGAYAMITGVREHDGWLYAGSLHEHAVARMRLPG